ncbi:hypothetical protein MMC13_008144 [Lambiella insularis]|nr:hypothetical protein [Lambiella insularis]
MGWRIQITVQAVTEIDFVYGLGNIALVAHLEVWLGIIVACLLTLPPLFSKYVTPLVSKFPGYSSKRTIGRQLKEAQHTIGSSETRGFCKKNFSRLDTTSLLELEEGRKFRKPQIGVNALPAAQRKEPQLIKYSNGIGVRHDLNVQDDLAALDSPASKAIRQALKQELAAPGAQYAYYGQAIEKPELVFVFVGWATIEDLQKWTSSAAHTASPVHDLISGPASTLHVPLDPAPALGVHPAVHVSELVFNYFPADLSAPQIASIMTSVDQMRPVMARSESLCVFDAWALQDAPVPGRAERGKVFVNVVGWESVEAHGRMTASEDFTAHIHHLLGITDMLASELYHAKMVRVE